MIVSLAAILVVAPTRAPAAEDAEELARERNYGFAEYENEEFQKAAEHFQRCVALAPGGVADRINLAVSAVQGHDQQKAVEVLLKAREVDASYPHIPYLLGIVYLRLEDLEKARTELETVLRMDPLCAPAHYNLGAALKKLRREDEAVAQWTETVRLDPNYGPAHFQLFNFYNAHGDHDKAQAAFREYMRTKQNNLGPGTKSADVEKSRYFALITETVRAKRGSATTVDVTLHDATVEVGLEHADGAAAAALADVDDDGNLDLLLGRTLYRNQSGHFVNITAKAGIMRAEPATCADFGDFDNDGKLDVVIGGPSGLRLYQGHGDGTFADVTEHAGLSKALTGTACTQARFVDIDHEGDLDLVIGVGSSNHAVRVFQNNGNGTFTEVSNPSHIGATHGQVQSLALADFDGRNDIDLFVAEAGGAHALYLNQRDGTFRENAAAAGIRTGARTSAALAGDVNGDGLADIVLLGPRTEVWLNRGDAKFVKDASAPIVGRITAALAVRAGALVDLDNDGDLDLVVAGEKGLGVFRNDGAGGWTDVTAAVAGGTSPDKGVRVVLVGDVDNDGDQDLMVITPGGPVAVLRNDGGNKNHSLRLRLRGRKNNPDGYGAKVWVRQGSFSLLRETFERWIDIGVGDHTIVDVVGLRWPTGVTQNQLNVQVDKRTPLELSERPGLAESCPFVYAFDGARFRFVTDLLDTTPLGVSLVPGQPFVPNHREAIRIPGRALVAKDGVLSLRVTQELEEITYLDSLRLYVVDHPAGTAVVPNDRFSDPPFAPFVIHTVRPQAPRSAVDGTGRNVLPALVHADRLYAYDCPPITRQYPGITSMHEIILDPGALGGSDHLMLFLRGTTLWTDASVNFAVAQNPDVPVRPLALDVVGQGGEWLRVRDDIGLPAGMDKTLPVDLSGIFQSPDHRVRITTNMAVLWDEAFFAADATSSTVTELTPLFADLHYRGFSEVESPDGQLPESFAYDRLMTTPPFEGAHAGRYTRYGDVSALLQEPDDMYVILAPGDEVAIDFPAITLPELPSGWERDYVLDADGWIKDRDLRTGHGETVEPLPFHAMSAYPYPATEHYPTRPAAARFLETYQTRVLP